MIAPSGVHRPYNAGGSVSFRFGTNKAMDLLDVGEECYLGYDVCSQ